MTEIGPLPGDPPRDSDLRRDARILLAHVLGRKHPSPSDSATLFSADQKARFLDLWRRRRAGEPVQYLIGEWEFFGRTFLTDTRALIPRPESEHLVEEALRENRAPRWLIDLGCGSGILALTLALECPATRVIALDASVEALALARENARLHDVENRVMFVGSDWLKAVDNARFDLAVANPPYVSTADRETLPANVRNFEPASALFAGDTGLSEIRKLLSDLPRVLLSGSPFLFELGFGQRETVAAEIARLPDWELRRFVPDLSGIPRVGVLRRR